MTSYAQLKSSTIFTLCRDSQSTPQLYEKIGPGHYRKGVYQLNNVCMPARCLGPLGAKEPVKIVKQEIVNSIRRSN